MKRYSKYIVLSIILISIFFIGNKVQAVEDENLFMYVDTETIVKGYTAEINKWSHSEWGDFRVAIVPGLVSEPIYLDVKRFDSKELPDPAGLSRVSDSYIYDILREDQESKEPFHLQKPFVISLKFNSDNLFRKKIFYWNKPSQSWIALPSSADYVNGYIRAYSHLPFSRVAVFEDTSELEGKASWYRSSKYSYGVASNNYPMGTKLRVKNVDNGKIVVVEVVSTGPFAPERVVDLTLPAFRQIEEQWKGLARVQVWPVENEVKVLGVDVIAEEPKPSVAEPHPAARAVIAINEKTGAIIYSKNYDTVLPIASITKLMTAAVFLDTNTPFDEEITYLAEDEYNTYGSKLYVSHGEIMTVKDLYYTMLVGSANNAANALARSTGLSREEFVIRMNEKATVWGLSNTHFVDVNGLDPANVSTVYEVAIMSKNILNDFRVLQGTTTSAYGFRTLNTDNPHTIKNSAKGVFEYDLVDDSLIITGMKTGYLDEAGYCFMMKSRTEKDGDNHVITVVLGAEASNQRYTETNDLMKYSLSKL